MSEALIETEVEELVEAVFDEFIAEYELDPEGSINDMFYELFLAGFEAAINMVNEEEE
jgi:hypothetical protein